MDDVELRFVMRVVVIEQREGYSTGQRKQFLQYRKQIRNTSASNDLSGLVTEWSEWIDVPTVEE